MTLTKIGGEIGGGGLLHTFGGGSSQVPRSLKTISVNTYDLNYSE